MENEREIVDADDDFMTQMKMNIHVKYTYRDRYLYEYDDDVLIHVWKIYTHTRWHTNYVKWENVLHMYHWYKMKWNEMKWNDMR